MLEARCDDGRALVSEEDKHRTDRVQTRAGDKSYVFRRQTAARRDQHVDDQVEWMAANVIARGVATAAVSWEHHVVHDRKSMESCPAQRSVLWRMYLMQKPEREVEHAIREGAHF